MAVSSRFFDAHAAPCTNADERRRFDPEFIEFQYHMKSGPWEVIRPIIAKLERVPTYAFKVVRRAERIYKMTRVLTDIAVDGVRHLGTEWCKMELYDGRW